MAPRRGRPPRESTLLESYAPSTPARPTLTEKQFMAQVQELARVLGWHVYHPWLSIRSERGFPDLTLARPGRLLFIEFKAEGGRTTPSVVAFAKDGQRLVGTPRKAQGDRSPVSLLAHRACENGVEPRTRRQRHVRLSVAGGLDATSAPLSLGWTPGWPLLALRRCVAHQAEQQIVGPGERDRNGAEDNDEERNERPDANDVMPVEIARLAGSVGAPEPGDLADLGPGGGPRNPEIGARDDDEEEEQVRPSGDDARGGA